MAKTVLITGCSSGIGRATARAFRGEDWIVYATARDADDVSDLADLGCETAALDVTDPGAVESVVDRIVTEEGRIDCLVNNAGYGQFGPVEDLPTDALHRQFDVNVYGPHRTVRAVLPHMRERGDGRIVNVSSVASRIVTPGMGAYSGSKAALEALTDALRNEVEAYGIEAVLVQPGPVETEFGERAEDQFAALERSGAYESLYRIFEDRQLLGGQLPVAVSPAAVAETILEAGVTPDPDPRYPVGTVAELALKTRLLPDGVRDAGFRLLSRVA
jgi:NAD(P)-dependent dehydrogenase (short-subunit alcohol dehydrogenase family)